MNRPTFLDHDRASSLPVVTLGITSLAILAATSEGMQQFLEFDRAAIGSGQLWRIVTGHLIHWNGDHLLWDALMFGALGVVCERADCRRFVICLFGSALAISASIFWLLPSTVLYRGLSGVDSALFILACSECLREARRNGDHALLIPVVAALFGFGAKLVYEMITGSTLFVDSTGAGFIPLPLAHAVGAVVGVGAAFFPDSAGGRVRLVYCPIGTKRPPGFGKSAGPWSQSA